MSQTHFFQQAFSQAQRVIVEAPQELAWTVNCRQPLEFLAGFCAGLSAHRDIWVTHPEWTHPQWLQLPPLARAWWGQEPPSYKACGLILPSESGAPVSGPFIYLPTGGSAGAIKFARHRWKTLCTAALGLLEGWGIEVYHSLCVLPFWHVSGLMQWVRACVSGGTLALPDFRCLKVGDYPPLPSEGSWLSLVPHQLQGLMQEPESVRQLRQFRGIFIGGTQLQEDLLKRAQTLGVPLAPCYGMTETAAMVAALCPEDFLKEGPEGGAGPLLPHAQLVDPASQAQFATPLCLKTAALCEGLYGDPARPLKHLLTQDLGFVDTAGRLHLLGRQDRVWCTPAGKKIHLGQWEEVLSTYPGVEGVSISPPEGSTPLTIRYRCSLTGASFPTQQELESFLIRQVGAVAGPIAWENCPDWTGRKSLLHYLPAQSD